jgi:hypothetical protein
MNSSIALSFRQASWLQQRNSISSTTKACKRAPFGTSNALKSRRNRALQNNLKKQDQIPTSNSPTGTYTKTKTDKVETSFASNPISWYSQKLESHPLITKCITSGIIAGTGDLTCQFIVHCKEGGNTQEEGQPLSKGNDFQPDLVRTSRFTFLGLALIAPVVHFWYGTLMMRIPGTSTKAVLQRLFLDQAFFAPLFIPTFLTNLMMLEGKPYKEVPGALVRDLPDIVVTNWVLWIPAMFINFKFVPGKWQVLYSNGVGFVWNTYLSWKTQENQKRILIE